MSLVRLKREISWADEKLENHELIYCVLHSAPHTHQEIMQDVQEGENEK